jgi:hypothetical protein
LEEGSTVFADLLWTAPELLRHGNRKADKTNSFLAQADMYSFGIVLFEIIGRAGPWGDETLPAAGLCLWNNEIWLNRDFSRFYEYLTGENYILNPQFQKSSKKSNSSTALHFDQILPP